MNGSMLLLLPSPCTTSFSLCFSPHLLQDFLSAFITVAPRDSILYTLRRTALRTEEIDGGEAKETIMAPERKVWKVLFVDDEEGIRKVMEITLADVGYQVLIVPGGEAPPWLASKVFTQVVQKLQAKTLKRPFTAAASRATASGGLTRRRAAAGRVTWTRHAVSSRPR
jgi:CheY-like chemotaxis protein